MPQRSHNAVIGSSPCRYSAMKAIFSSAIQVSFHGIGKGPPLPMKKTCQASIRSILFDMYPVQTPPSPLTPTLSLEGEGEDVRRPSPSPLRGEGGTRAGGRVTGKRLRSL